MEESSLVLATSRVSSRLIHITPDGGPRLVQRARGIAWSFVNGGTVIRDGKLPDSPESRGSGRVLRPVAA